MNSCITLNRDMYINTNAECLAQCIEQFLEQNADVQTLFLQCSLQEVYKKLIDPLFNLQQKHKKTIVTNFLNNEKCFNGNNFFNLQIVQQGYQFRILHIFPECLCYRVQLLNKTMRANYYALFLTQDNDFRILHADQEIYFSFDFKNDPKRLFDYQLYSHAFLQQRNMLNDDATNYMYNSYLKQRNFALSQKNYNIEDLKVAFIINENLQIYKELQEMLKTLKQMHDIQFGEVQFIYLPINNINEAKILNFEDTVDVFVIASGCERTNLMIATLYQKYKNIVNLFEFLTQLGVIKYNVENYEINVSEVIKSLTNISQNYQN